MRIFLIGFMGCGKSTYGLELARAIDFEFWDLDEMVQDMEAMTISQMFSQYGEYYFRERERSCLHNMLQIEKSVIATGGGTPCFFDNIDWMNNNGITIYLKMSPGMLINRLKKEPGNRPLLNNINQEKLMEFITHKLEERSEFYEKAHLIFNIDDEDVDVISELRKSMIRIIGH